MPVNVTGRKGYLKGVGMGTSAVRNMALSGYGNKWHSHSTWQWKKVPLSICVWQEGVFKGCADRWVVWQDSLRGCGRAGGRACRCGNRLMDENCRDDVARLCLGQCQG